MREWLNRDDSNITMSEAIDSETGVPICDNVIPVDVSEMLGEFIHLQKNNIFQEYFRQMLGGGGTVEWNQLLAFYKDSRQKYIVLKSRIAKGML